MRLSTHPRRNCRPCDEETTIEGEPGWNPGGVMHVLDSLDGSGCASVVRCVICTYRGIHRIEVMLSIAGKVGSGIEDFS